jgi:hypothetical protein
MEIVFPYGFTVRVSYKRCTLLCFAFIPPCLVSSKLRDHVDVANVTDSIQGRERAAQCRSQAITIAARKSAQNELKLGRSLSLKPEAHQPKVNVRRSERKRY